MIFTYNFYINFCDISPRLENTIDSFADFNEVGHLEFMKRGQQKINLRVCATILQWLFYVCTHLLCVLAVCDITCLYHIKQPS